MSVQDRDPSVERWALFCQHKNEDVHLRATFSDYNAAEHVRAKHYPDTEKNMFKVVHIRLNGKKQIFIMHDHENPRDVSNVASPASPLTKTFSASAPCGSEPGPNVVARTLNIPPTHTAGRELTMDERYPTTPCVDLRNNSGAAARYTRDEE